MKRAQQVLLECFPEPQFGGDAAAEELADVDAVAAFGGCGQAEQFDGLHVIEQPPIGRGLGVVELVDHHDVEVIGLDGGKPFGGQRLDAGEDVAPFGRLIPVDQQFTERRLGQHLLIHPPRLRAESPCGGPRTAASGRGRGSRAPAGDNPARR